MFCCELEISLPKRDNPADINGTNYQYPLIGTWERVSGDGGDRITFLKSEEYTVQSGDFGENFFLGKWFYRNGNQKSIQIESNDKSKLKTILTEYYDYDNVQLSWDTIENNSSSAVIYSGIYKRL